MEKKLATMALSLLAASFIAASVFAYYPLTLTVQPTTPPVVFETGSNANQNDLGPSNTIVVSIGSNSTSATVTIHPTYQRTYYRDVLRIKNNDAKAYYVWLSLESVSNSLPPGSRVSLLVGSQNITLTSLSTGAKVQVGPISGSSTLTIDIEVYIPEGSSISGASATFNLNAIYTPSSSEEPP